MSSESDLAFFVTVVGAGSLAAAAQELNLTAPAVSKRLARLEDRLGVRLMNRTTRRSSLTGEGEVFLAHARRILADIEEMEGQIGSSRAEPKGLLRVNASLGFGRTCVGPSVAAFVRRYPHVEVRLHLTDRPVPLPSEDIDIAIRFGDQPDSRLIASKIADNRRLLCASPAYLARRGRPAVPSDLSRHDCIVLRQNDTVYGQWHFAKGRGNETVKVHGPLSTNDGAVALNWALEGHGILMRSEWNVAALLRDGRLEEVLPGYRTPSADIYAVYPERLNLTAKIAMFAAHLRADLRGRMEGASPAEG